MGFPKRMIEERNKFVVVDYLGEKDKIADIKAGKFSVPPHLQIDLEAFCNHDCSFCAYRNSGWQTEEGGMQFQTPEWAPDPSFVQIGKPKGKVVKNVSGIPLDVMVRMLEEAPQVGVKSIEYSVRGDEILPIEEKGFIKIVEIQDFVDRFTHLEGMKCIHEPTIKSWSLNDVALKDDVTCVFKHKNEDKLFKITLVSGRHITVTGHHSIFFYEDGEIRQKKIQDAKIGDLIVLSRAKFFENKPKEILITTEGFDNRRNTTPNEFVIDSDFCRLLGYFIAEGSYEYCRNIIHGIVFTFGGYEIEQNYIDDVVSILRSRGLEPSIYKKKNKTQIKVCKKWLGQLFQSLNTGNHAITKRVPDIIFNLNEICRLEFLKGLYAGDGNYRETYNRNCKRNILGLKTASIQLQRTLALLLDSLGIFYSVGEHLNKKRFIEGRELPVTKAFTVHVNNKTDLEPLKVVIEFLGGKLEYKTKLSNPGRRTKLIDINEDAYALPIKKIESFESDEIVYDISVGNSHRFESSFRILCHNTGGGESLIHPYAHEILQKTRDVELGIALVTNGSLLHKFERDLAGYDKFTWLRISMDSCTPETHQRIHASNDFSKVVDNISRFVGMRDAQGGYPKIATSFVVTPENQHEIEGAARFYKGLGVNAIRYTAFYEPGLQGKLQPESRKDVEQRITKARAELEDDNFGVFGGLWKIDNYGLNTDFSSCGYMNFTWAISAFGDVFPCCIQKYFPGYEIGNIKEHTLREIAENRMSKYFESFNVQDCNPCLITGSEILSKNGIKKIEDLKKGEEVLTHKGKYKKIKKVMKRFVDEEIYKIRCKFNMLSEQEIKLTKNHPILVMRIKRKYNNHYKNTKTNTRCVKTQDIKQLFWLEPSEITKKDYLVFPIPKYNKQILAKEFKYKKFNKKQKVNLKVCKELMNIIGYYLAEGYVTNTEKRGNFGLTFTFGKNDKEYFLAKKCCDNIQTLGFNARVIREEGGWRTILDSVMLGRIFYENFGSGASQKSIPYWIKELPSELLWDLIQAYYEGDGCKIKNDRSKNYRFEAKTISKQLAFDMREILLKCRKKVSLREYTPKDIILGRKVNVKKAYVITYMDNDLHNIKTRIDDDYMYCKVISIEKENYQGLVHNLEIEKDETYCTTAFVVHNCWLRDHNKAIEFVAQEMDSRNKFAIGNMAHFKKDGK